MLQQAPGVQGLDETPHIGFRLQCRDSKGTNQRLDEFVVRAMLGELLHEHSTTGIGGEVSGRTKIENDKVTVDFSPRKVVSTKFHVSPQRHPESAEADRL